MSVERLVARRGRKVHYRTIGDKKYSAVGFSWWAIRYADLVERRVVTDREWGHSKIRYNPRPKQAFQDRQTLTEAPELGVRPENMSRQVQRRLHRDLCKQLGVPRHTGR